MEGKLETLKLPYLIKAAMKDIYYVVFTYRKEELLEGFEQNSIKIWITFGRIALLRKENPGDAVGWQERKRNKISILFISILLHIINAIIYSLGNPLFLLSRLSLRLYFSFTALLAASIGHHNNHFNHLSIAKHQRF